MLCTASHQATCQFSLGSVKECASKLSLCFDGSAVEVVPTQVFGHDSDTPVIPSGTFGVERANLHEMCR
jgi:hypothetical protein